jgi:hypothetical protein
VFDGGGAGGLTPPLWLSGPPGVPVPWLPWPALPWPPVDGVLPPVAGGVAEPPEPPDEPDPVVPVVSVVVSSAVVSLVTADPSGTGGGCVAAGWLEFELSPPPLLKTAATTITKSRAQPIAISLRRQ